MKNPVQKYQPDDIFLNDDEIRKLEIISLSDVKLEIVRDLFLIGVYSGQRFSDYSVFEKEDIHGEMIIKKAEKTETECFIPIHERLKILLDKYEWKLPSISGDRFNILIRKVCKLAGFEEKIKDIIYRGAEKIIIYKPKYEMVSSHTARRTFITLSSEKGMPDHIIMKITGIKEPKTLLKYKKTSQKSVVDSMQKYWG
ncbi:site-specific integrase [Labilibaculum euxinus]